MRVTGIQRAICLGVAVLAPGASGKPVHFEQLKSDLIAFAIRCTDCHKSDTDATLTTYGQRIADLGPEPLVQDRVREFEAALSQTASEERRRLERPRIDVDGDDIVNWVEILAGTDPSQPSQRNELHDRIERVISCKLCHTSVSKFPVPGKERAPHNAFGQALKEADRVGRRGKRGSQVEDEDAPTQPIAPRLNKLRMKDSDRDRIQNWDEILTFHHPADPGDKPTKEAARAVRKRFRELRRTNFGYGPSHKKGRRRRQD